MKEPTLAPDWNEVPQSAQFLIPYVEQFGCRRSDADILAAIGSLSTTQIEELSELGSKVKSLRLFLDVINPWIGAAEITKSEAAAYFYFFFYFLDLAGIEFDE